VNYGNNTVGNIDGNGNYTAPDNIVGLGSVTITATSVANPAKSDSATVTLTNPVPTLTSITPATLGLGAFQITLYGTGFVSTSTATFGAQAMQVTYVTPTLITAIGSASNNQLGSVTVKVNNPAPGGGTSNGLNVTVTTAGSPVSSAAAVRFLEQSSFGPDMENVNQVMETGFDTYLQNQFGSTVTPYPDPRPNDSVNNVQNSFFLECHCRRRSGSYAQRLGTERTVGGERKHHKQPIGLHQLPAHAQQGRVGKLSRRDDRCDADSGNGQFPEHGEQ
jgi:hypothetical protein